MIGPAYGAALRVRAPEPGRPARRRARGARGGPRPGAGARDGQAGRPAGRTEAQLIAE